MERRRKRRRKKKRAKDHPRTRRRTKARKSRRIPCRRAKSQKLPRWRLLLPSSREQLWTHGRRSGGESPNGQRGISRRSHPRRTLPPQRLGRTRVPVLPGKQKERHGLWPVQQGAPALGDVSWDVDRTSSSANATCPGARGRSRRPSGQNSPSGHGLLPSGDVQEGLRAHIPGDDDLSGNAGCSPERPCLSGGGFDHPTTEVSGANPSGPALVRVPAAGDTSGRNFDVDSTHRSSPGQERSFPRSKDAVCSSLPGWEATQVSGNWWQRQKRQRTGKGRQQRQEQEPRRKRRQEWEERSDELRSGNAPLHTGPALGNSFPEIAQPAGDLNASSYEGGVATAPCCEDAELALAPEGGNPIHTTGGLAQSLHVTGAPALKMNSFESVMDNAGPMCQASFSMPFEDADGRERVRKKKGGVLADLDGKNMSTCGSFLLQRLLECLPLRSQYTGKVGNLALFPLPSSRDVFLELDETAGDDVLSWMTCLCISLNSVWGGDLFHEGDVRPVQWKCLEMLLGQVKRFCCFDAPLENLDWESFLKVKTIDYKGDEVKVARYFKWENINPALPLEIGRVPLSEVCTLGCKYYVENFDLYLKPREDWKIVKAPRVMVEDCDWSAVCDGLVKAGVCCFLEEHEVFSIDGSPLLNGLFGVTKDDFTDSGIEIYRLIMNLIPLNELCMPLSGDVATLPTWSAMSPFFLQPHENLLVSSEDVKCFFYVMQVPQCWVKFLAFNKLVPDEVLSPELRGQGRRFYLASVVLPMGFLNSVSLVRRNLAQYSADRLSLEDSGQLQSSMVFRKDKPFPVGTPLWRIYLDNYDLLEKVKATKMVELEGSTAPGALALREEYVHWDVPRNVKKSVQRASKCEVQGATVDGVEGIAYPRESKLGKYFSLALSLLESHSGTQKQWQVVCGGLVYFTMFRRPLLGCLNRVWQHIEQFKSSPSRYRPHPQDCRIEVLRLLGLLPLAFMNFRLSVHPLVTASDASSKGGGICVSSGTTRLGSSVASGGLRGQLPDEHGDQQILVVGLFDGIGALRVAIELLGIPVLGYVSVERHAPGHRVVESHFPGVVLFNDVRDITGEVVKQLSTQFSQASMVLLGAGPPCQGVSGLNYDRKGALRDQRSCLFSEVPRIRKLFQDHFCWCPTFSLMESVASMDEADRDTMTQGIGDQPIWCDAGCFTWCHRPRLYWCNWELVEGHGFSLTQATNSSPSRLFLEGSQVLSSVLRAGWLKVAPEKPFPTFTTSRPNPLPGRKPAGIAQCTVEDLQRWSEDHHRFPPYQYMESNCVVNAANVLRVPDVAEREMMLGFPVDYTQSCLPKSQRKSSEANDVRLTLLGNSWSVPVVACLLSQLFSRLGFIEPITPQEILNRLVPGTDPAVQGRLFRLPLNPSRSGTEDLSQELAYKLSNLVSIKGEDIMLTGTTNQQAKFHRLRATVPSRCWKWKIVTGWRWKHPGEHINSLELKAVLTTLRWRVEHQLHLGTRMIHLTDSLVCLHALCRGRIYFGRRPSALLGIRAHRPESSGQALKVGAKSPHKVSECQSVSFWKPPNPKKEQSNVVPWARSANLRCSLPPVAGMTLHWMVFYSFSASTIFSFLLNEPKWILLFVTILNTCGAQAWAGPKLMIQWQHFKTINPIFEATCKVPSVFSKPGRSTRSPTEPHLFLN